MNERRSETRPAILQAAIDLIETNGSGALRVQDVAERAEVGIPTIYYYFENRARLVAFAQAERFKGMLQMTIGSRDQMIKAIAVGDLTRYSVAASAEENFLWEDGIRPRLWDLIDALSDVRRDPMVRQEVMKSLDAAMAPRVEAVKKLQELGWMTPEVDAAAWVSLYFSAIVGQVFLDLSSVLQHSPEDRADVLNLIRAALTPMGASRQALPPARPELPPTGP